MSHHQRIHYLQASDHVKLAWAETGTGPVLVKASNWLSHLEYDWESPIWNHWVRFFSDRFRFVRYDERGCGMSDWNIDDLSFDRRFADLEAVIEAAGIGEPFAMLGISQGAGICIAYAIRHPERVSRLVLYGGYVQGVVARARTQQELDEVNMIMHAIPLGWGYDNPAFRMFFAARFLPEGTAEQIRWFSDLQRITTSPQMGARLLDTAATIDVTELAPKVRAPTLVLHATGDAVTTFGQGRMLAALIPGARFVPLEGRNHVLLESEPAWTRFADEVHRFLAEDALITPAPTRGRPQSKPPTRSRSR